MSPVDSRQIRSWQRPTRRAVLARASALLYRVSGCDDAPPPRRSACCADCANILLRVHLNSHRDSFESHPAGLEHAIARVMRRSMKWYMPA